MYLLFVIIILVKTTFCSKSSGNTSPLSNSLQLKPVLLMPWKNPDLFLHYYTLTSSPPTLLIHNLSASVPGILSHRTFVAPSAWKVLSPSTLPLSLPYLLHIGGQDNCILNTEMNTSYPLSALLEVLVQLSLSWA